MLTFGNRENWLENMNFLGTWLAQMVEHVTLGFGAVGLSHKSGVDCLKIKSFLKREKRNFLCPWYNTHLFSVILNGFGNEIPEENNNIFKN